MLPQSVDTTFLALPDASNLPLPSTISFHLKRKILIEASRWIREACRSDSSRAVYKSDLRIFFRYLKVYRYPSLFTARTVVSDYHLHNIETLKRSPSSCARKLTVIKSFAKHLSACNLIPEYISDQISNIKSIKVPKDGMTPAFSWEQAQSIIGTADASTIRGLRDQALLATLFYTGARSSAVRNIKFGHITKEGDHTFITLSEKGNKKHRVVIHGTLNSYLAPWLNVAQISEPDQYLFPSFKTSSDDLTNTPMNKATLWRLIRSYANKAGIDINRYEQSRGLCTHSTRSTLATHLLGKLNVPLHQVQAVLNHADPRTTMRYKRETENDMIAAISAI